jgi:multicomponent Na+:H+ antiporter subunit A
MQAVTGVLAGFGVAFVSPWIARVTQRWSGLILAALPLTLFAGFVRFGSEVAAGGVHLERHSWVPALGLSLSFRVDGLGLLFALLITGVGTLVVLYAGRYLQGHPALGRFFLFLLFFMASMLGLVLTDNLLALYVFWELTSLSSYALIGFQHERVQARKAALQGLLVTVAGGQAMLAGLLLLGGMAGTLELSELLVQGDALRAHPLYLPALLLIVLGAFTKSAQLPFHSWLPGAMEAPTPVSAYLHSATMVKAGVYLLMRLNPALGGTEAWWSLLTVVGGATMVWGSCVALAQTDLKRLLAYATLSVLGLLVLLVGLGTPASLQAAVAFLVAHALYKGALFLVAGAVDHEAGTRDVGQLRGLVRAMPLTAAAAGLAALAMAGLMPAFGFIGKELVYEAALTSPRAGGLLPAAAVLAFTLLVAVAVIVGVRPFLGAPGATPRTPHEAPASMWLGPVVLAALGLVFGVLPTVLDPLLAAVAVSLSPGASYVPLKLWHGLNAALGLSALSLAGGLAVYRAREPLRRSLQALPFSRWKPAWGFEAALQGLMAVARAQTRLLQTGFLRHYLLATLGTTFTLLGFTLLTRGGAWPKVDFSNVRFYELGVAAIAVMAAIATAYSRSRLGAVAAMGVVGFCVALIFLFFGAPDLALTQSIVEALTVVIFLLAIFHLPRYRELSSARVLLRDAVLSLGAGGLMTALVLRASYQQLHPPVSSYHAETSLPEAHGRNVVNVILTDFRALDTLGEITVIAIAGLGVHAILKLRPRAREGA